MALVVQNSGKLLLLQFMIQQATNNNNYILNLYTNNFTPVDTATTANYTYATFTNYAPKTLTRANWGNPTQSGTSASSQYSQVSWTCGTSGQSITGYTVVDSASGSLLWSEMFSVSRTLANGDVLNLTPQIALDSANSP